MSNPLNIPSTITAAELLAAGLTQAEITALGDTVAPPAGEAAAGDATPADPQAPAPKPAPSQHAAGMGYDADEMPGHDGTDGEIVVVDAENDLGEGDGTVIREYDPVRDEEPDTPATPEVPEVPAEDAPAPDDTPDPEVAALLELRRPEIPAQAVSTAEEQATVRQEMAALRESYNDGDIEHEAYEQQVEALTDRLADLRATERVAVQAVQPGMEQFREGWFNLVDRHMEANPILKDDPEVLQGFDAILKQVSGDPNLRTLPAIQQIEIAHSRLAAAYLVARQEHMPGIVSLRSAKPAPAKQEPKKAETPQTPAKATGPRTDARPDAPVTLAGVAGAQQDGGLSGDPIVDEVKAIINSGDAMAAERAMARLSPAQLDALIRS